MRPEDTFKRIKLSRRRALMLGAAGFIGLTLTGQLHAQSVPEAEPTSIMTPTEAHDQALSGEVILVDIRRPDEWLETGVGEGAIALDMRTDEFVSQLVTLRRANPDTPIALICRTGNRSKFVVSTLAGQGFPGLVDIAEGMVGGRNGAGWVPTGLATYAGTPENIAAELAKQLPSDQ